MSDPDGGAPMVGIVAGCRRRVRSAMWRRIGIVFTLLGVTLIILGRDLLFPEDTTFDVVLVSIGTLRADHLGCYGYPLGTSPNLDEFRGDAILFENVIAQAPSTLPSHASIFSSLIPQHHGACYAETRGLAEEVLTLTEVLAGDGFRTVSFNGGGQISMEFGIAQGFDVYESVKGDDSLSDMITLAIGELDAMRKHRSFLFLHTLEVHHPYRPSQENLRLFRGDYSGPLPDQIEVPVINAINAGELEIDDEDLHHIIATYDAEIRSMDQAFGRLVRELKERNLYDRTMIIFTSDHGEEFSEHGMVGWHSHTLFDELLRVPLLIKLPHQMHAGKSITNLVSGIDVAPTILEGLGLEAPPAFSGRDAISDHLTGASERSVISHQDTEESLNITSLRTGRWKLYKGRLFDLKSDPEEKADVASIHPEVVEALEAELERRIEERSASGTRSAVAISEEARKRSTSSPVEGTWAGVPFWGGFLSAVTRCSWRGRRSSPCWRFSARSPGRRSSAGTSIGAVAFLRCGVPTSTETTSSPRCGRFVTMATRSSRTSRSHRWRNSPRSGWTRRASCMRSRSRGRSSGSRSRKESRSPFRFPVSSRRRGCSGIQGLSLIYPEGVEAWSVQALGDEDWRPRMQAVDNLSSHRTRSAVDALIRATGDVRPVVSHRAMSSLSALTGMKWTLKEQWEEWWQKNRDTVTLEEGSPVPARPAPSERYATFNNIEIVSDHVAFLIDKSSDMKHQQGQGKSKDEAARAELEATLVRLGGGFLFNVFTYSDEAVAFNPKPVELSKTLTRATSP